MQVFYIQGVCALAMHVCSIIMLDLFITLHHQLIANDSGWEPKVKRASSKWKRIVRQWLSVKDFPVLIVGYENLMNNTYAELKRMLNFIGHPYTEDSVMCTVKNSGEVFHRKHTKKQENPYSPELQEFVLNQIKEIDTSLQEHNISLHHPYTV